MRPLAFLKCVAKGALKHAVNLAGFGLGEIAEEVWKEGFKDKDECARRAELEALVQMAGEQLRQQVEAVVREVAADQPPAVRQRLSVYLHQVPDFARKAFRRPDDPKGQSVPPGFRLRQAGDLAPLLSVPLDEPSALEPRPQVTLRFTRGTRKGETIVRTEPAVLLFGRAEDCDPRFAEDGHKRVSRHHCLVEINPPDVCVRDLGSRNGTYVNSELIGKRPEGTQPGSQYASREHDLVDGAEVCLTDAKVVAFQVEVLVPARCGNCGAGISEEHKSSCVREGGGYLCMRCRQEVRPAGGVLKPCAWCGREAKDERGANRPGLFVCPDCRGNLQGMIGDLLGQAKAGAPDLRAIRDYELLEELGHGGMGAVYLARHRQTGAAAAIKLMLPKVAADDGAVALFQREVRNTMSLRHRHVVRLLDHGYAKGAFFMVLEHCDGGSAEGLLQQRGGRLALDEAVEIVLQALEGLDYCHSADVPFVKQKGGGFGPGKGIVHRDLKPANLFLTGWGSSRIVKLGDYGLAKAFEETGLSGGTRTGDTAGTWQFMCRRQVVHYKDAGAEVDVWSMAATLYNLLTGHFPRDFPEGQDPWLAVLENKPVPIQKRNPHVPRKLAEVIDHALTEEPEMPYKTARELMQALEGAL